MYKTRMTDREEIERLLNQTGRTLEGLPERYPIWAARETVNRIGGSTGKVGNMLLHQSDVIELLIGALRDALDKQPKWISGSCPPKERGEVLVIARGKPKPNIQLLDAYELAEYAPGEGWIFEAYPEWEDAEVRWWMPLPEEPEEGKNEAE